MTKKAASPAATGPGGAHFEAKVGAYYLLALLLDAEPRGLPGTRIERIQLQGGGDDYPLDDVIVHARTMAGAPATAEIQAKRKVTFSPGDTVFHDVLEQIADAVKAGKLESQDPYVMAVATAQGSRQIDGAYQEILLWARHVESADAFFRKLQRPKVTNESMRTFVDTLRGKLKEFGAPSDDDGVWKILRKLQILVFDFSAHDGQNETLARERCKQALDPSEQDKAGALWSTLTDIVQEIATSGGEIAAPTLRRTLAEKHGFKLAGLRQNRAAIAALSQASDGALRDVRNRVANVVLSRRDRLHLVNASLSRGRYVEILGDAGVGKSGILRALAEQAAIGGTIIVLTPTRTAPRGWAALRNEIGFDGSAADLLSDVAASGAATLFIDSADFFGEAARSTVNDLVRAAATIFGFNIVVTARRSFGTDEPNWIAADALEILGRAPAVVIDELTDDEIAELRSAAPQLVPLLADGHPAREVVRNLFRLDRLVEQGQSAQIPRTEAEMARIWWSTGDGKNDALLRDRARILRDLAERSLSGDVGPLNTSAHLAQPLDALVRSGTLKDLGGERMIFRHDVFRDWAVANLLHENGAMFSSLPLARPAPTSLFRGVDLAARLAIEESADADAWQRLLHKLSDPEVHGSWRRAIVIALVRSEISDEVLTRAEGVLLAHDGALLRDLVRTLMALDVMPASQLLAGLSLPEGVADLVMPVGPSWRRLILWLLALNNRLPPKIIPDVVKLYVHYASAMWVFDPVVSRLVTQLHAWLMEMEGACVVTYGPHLAGMDYEDRHALHAYLRSSFLAFSTVKPDLAEGYVRHLLSDVRAARHSAESVIMMPGSLAKAAPAALSELTAATLIESPKPKRRSFNRYDEPEAFTYTDKEFLSPSPARGPFLELLVHAPQIGLALVRTIVTHACTFGRQAKTGKNDDAVVIEMESGPRRFPYIGSYYWSRDANGYYSVTSALMALEAWAHRRMDAGEGAENLIADILGDGEAPAAYLLVVVDVILSHWSQSWHFAIPFVASPELLSWDRSRQTRDQMGPDLNLFGDKEPHGSATRESLKNRGSRRAMLERTLPIYAFHAPEPDLEALRKRLESATGRLGPYESHSDFSDPRFMVRYALNVIDRNNYAAQERVDEAGNKQTVFEYVSPPDEASHLAALGQKRSGHLIDANRRAEITLALDDAARGSIDLVGRSITWAKEVEASGEEQQDFDHSVLISALLLMRDGNEVQRLEHGAWSTAQFSDAVTREEDPVHRMRDGLMFNPVGIGAAGLVLSFFHGKGLADARPLLELAVKGDPAAAHGFGSVLEKLAAIHPRLPRAVLRCAFVGNIRPHLKRYDADHAEEDAARQRQVAGWRLTAVNAEWCWLQGEGEEPAWPVFPDPRINVREPMYIGDPPARRRREPKPESNYYADHQAAAVWLSKFLGGELVAPAWMREVARQYSDWTSKLNGSGLESEQELAREPNGWNVAYFRLVARSLTGLDADAIDALCLSPVIVLPDEPFLDVSADLQLSIDIVYFRGQGLSEVHALRLRTGLVNRLKQTSQWRRFADRPGYGIPFHLDGALGTAFMAEQGFRQPPHCYVTALGIARAEPFIPLLTELAEQTPSLFVAKAALSIATVSPDHPYLAFGVKALSVCMARYPDDTKIWIDYDVGAQFCRWIDGILRSSGTAALEKAGVRGPVEKLLSDLIRLGVPEAASLEARVLEPTGRPQD